MAEWFVDELPSLPSLLIKIYLFYKKNIYVIINE